MGWFSWLTSSKDVMDKNDGLLAQAGNWIGNFNYTDEERAEAKERLNDGVAEYVKATLSESTVRSRTRRSIAIAWICVELFLVLATALTGVFNPEYARFLWTICTSDLMFWGTMSVIGFFFGPYMIGSHFNKKK